MPKTVIDPRLSRLRGLYRAVDAMPDRLREYRKLHKEELARMKQEIARAWESIEATGKEQTPLDFPIHHGSTLVGRSRQPKTGTGD